MKKYVPFELISRRFYQYVLFMVVYYYLDLDR